MQTGLLWTGLVCGLTLDFQNTGDTAQITFIAISVRCFRCAQDVKVKLLLPGIYCCAAFIFHQKYVGLVNFLDRGVCRNGLRRLGF